MEVVKTVTLNLLQPAKLRTRLLMFSEMPIDKLSLSWWLKVSKHRRQNFKAFFMEGLGSLGFIVRLPTTCLKMLLQF
ncbi:MAG: hypothetical protein ACUVTD_07830 [Nitrososphaerales archaeon]